MDSIWNPLKFYLGPKNGFSCWWHNFLNLRWSNFFSRFGSDKLKRNFLAPSISGDMVRFFYSAVSNSFWWMRLLSSLFLSYPLSFEYFFIIIFFPNDCFLIGERLNEFVFLLCSILSKLFLTLLCAQVLKLFWNLDPEIPPHLFV